MGLSQEDKTGLGPPVQGEPGEMKESRGRDGFLSKGRESSEGFVGLCHDR